MGIKLKRVFIVHGWGGAPSEGWFPWLKSELEKKGFKVNVLDIPDTQHPKIPAWVSTLSKAIGTPDEDTYLVGHSIGCQTIIRYLESLPVKEKIGGTVLVAAWVSLTGLDTGEEKNTAESWLSSHINFELVKKHSKKFSCVFSDNDPYVPRENSGFFKDRLNARIIIEKGKGHFTGKGEDEVFELPSALKELLEMAD